jgi:hypothetical protein
MTSSPSFAEAVSQCAHKTQQHLTQVGWTADRQQDITAYISQLAAAGHTIAPPAQAFLRAFAGIHFQFIIHHAGTNRDLDDDILLDPLGAAASIDPGWFRYYTTILNTPLCPIGSADHRHYLLLMDSWGRVLGAYGEFILFYGETGVQMLDNLIMQRPPTIVRGDMLNNPDSGQLLPPVAAVATNRQNGKEYKGVRGLPDALVEKQLMQQYGYPPKYPVPYTCCAETHACYVAARGKQLDQLDLFAWEVQTGSPRPRCTNCQVTINVGGMQLWSEPDPPFRP